MIRLVHGCEAVGSRQAGRMKLPPLHVGMHNRSLGPRGLHPHPGTHAPPGALDLRQRAHRLAGGLLRAGMSIDPSGR